MSGYINHDNTNLMSVTGPYVGAMYLALLPHYINNAEIPQGTILQEGVNIPAGWFPTLAVDPLNGTAVFNFYNAGPRDVATANSSDLMIWPIGIATIQPVTYWIQLPQQAIPTGQYVNHDNSNIMSANRPGGRGPNMFMLTGLGRVYPPYPPRGH